MRRSEIARSRESLPAQPAVVANPTSLSDVAKPLADAADIEALYFLGPQSQDGIDFDFEPLSPSFVANIDASGRPRTPFPPRTLLPENFIWRSPSGAQRIPMLLAEFCAYKAALAYGAKDKIIDKIGDATDFDFFDTAGSVTDTQGFGCYYDGMAFICMRGTEGGLKHADWRVNLSDNFTDQIDDKDAAMIAKLAKRFAADESWSEEIKTAHQAQLEELVGKLKGRPGMHLGFAMAWEEVSGKVVAYLDKLKSKYGAIPPIALTGHSLGGALATVGAYDLRHRGYPVAAVVTFGAPCVGNNFFAESYRDAKIGGFSLGERTVRFVADGDSVPKIMRRWYYRLLKGGRDAELTFDNVGSFLQFTGTPRTSLRLIEMAIEQEIKRREEEAQKSAKNATAKSLRSGSKSGGAALLLAPLMLIASSMLTSPTFSLGNDDVRGSAITRSTSTISTLSAIQLAQAQSPPPQAGTTTVTPDPSLEDDSMEISIWYFFLFFAIFASLIIVASTIQSHSVANRYALYLSTLAYQKIRSFRATSPEPLKSRLDAANGDLDRYLRFIRGDTREDMAAGKLLKVAELPVRLVEGMQLDVFKAANERQNIF